MSRPLVKDVSVDWPLIPGRRRVWIQAKGTTGDFVTPLPYNFAYRVGKAEYGPPWDGKPLPFDVANLNSPPVKQGAVNRAYGQFRQNALGVNSQLGATFAEWKQSLGMIANAALTARESWRSFRKGRLFKDIRKKIENQGGPTGTASKSWLQYWFGWAPLVGDVTNALKVLDQPIPFYEGSGSSGDAYFEQNTYIGDFIVDELSALYYIKVGARVYLDNRNLFLASQLGLINPVATAWELVPFSFLVDWSFDVGSYLNSFTDFVGCRIENPYTSVVVKKGVLKVHNMYLPQYSSSYELADFVRSTTLPVPTPNWEVGGNLGGSVTRAASAVSLLNETLRSAFR